MALLDRAAEVGLLTAHGNGRYAIHPALPWFFKELFDAHYPAGAERPGRLPGSQQSAAQAFVEAIGRLGNLYAHAYNLDKSAAVVAALSAEEHNLLQAWQLARAHGWWEAVLGTTEGLATLYRHTSRRVEWIRLANETVLNFIDVATGGPLPGREMAWGVVNQYRVEGAREARDWVQAERLQRATVEWDRQHVAAALSQPAETWDPDQLEVTRSEAIRSLSVSLHTLGQIQRESGKADCVFSFKEALDLAKRAGCRSSASASALSLGHVYKDFAALRDLAQAERWYQQSLELHGEHDKLGRGRCFGQLAMTALEQFHEERKARRSAHELRGHLKPRCRKASITSSLPMQSSSFRPARRLENRSRCPAK